MKILAVLKTQNELTLRDNEHTFNFALSSTRMTVECAFGILKTRFRCLLVKLPFRDMKMICATVSSCVLLHNTILADREPVSESDFGLKLDVNLVDRVIEEERQHSQRPPVGGDSDDVEEEPLVMIKRNALMNEICR